MTPIDERTIERLLGCSQEAVFEIEELRGGLLLDVWKERDNQFIVKPGPAGASIYVVNAEDVMAVEKEIKVLVKDDQYAVVCAIHPLGPCQVIVLQKGSVFCSLVIRQGAVREVCKVLHLDCGSEGVA